MSFLQLPELPQRRNSDTPATPALQLEVSTHAPDLLANLNKLRTDARFTDIALETDSGTLLAHKAVLMAASPYFHAMFSSDFKEQTGTIVLTSVAGGIVSLLLDFIYTSRIEINIDNAQDLIIACKFFQFPILIQPCLKFLLHHLDISNAIGMDNFAVTYEFPELGNASRQCIIENFMYLIESNDVVELSLDQLLFCVVSTDLCVRSENDVVRALLKWIQHEPATRDQLTDMLFKSVRLKHLSDDFVHLTLLESSTDKLYLSSVRNILNNFKTDAEDTVASCPRPSTLLRDHLVVFSIEYMESFNPVKDKWTRLANPKLLKCVKDAAVATLENEIWVTGGLNDSDVVIGEVVRYDPIANAWYTGPPLLTARAKHTCVNVRGTLVIMGGVDATGNLCTQVEMLRFTEQGLRLWTPAGCLFDYVCRQEACAVALSSSCIIEFGGLKGNQLVLNSLDQHLVTENGVEYTGEHYVLPKPLRKAQLLVIDDQILILCAQSGALWCLDPVRKSVKSLSSIKPQPTHLITSATVCDSALYCVEQGSTPVIYVYDPSSRLWSNIRSPKFATDIMFCVCLKL